MGARPLAALLLAAPAAAEPTARDCGRCHARHYEEWAGSAHARAATSALFRWQSLHLPAERAADCRRCHAPAGDAGEGVTCVYCHRMTAVAEEPPHTPKLGGPNVMRGPLGDAVDAIVHGSEKSELHQDERICLACHDHDAGAAGGPACCTVVREWREAEIRDLMKCQSCHMRGAKDVPVARGGPPRTRHRHNFPAAGDVDQARGGWELAFGRVAGRVVEVVVTNRSGHSLPNGEPYGTRVVLRVEARDAAGAIAGAAERSFGFEMLDAEGRPTIFPHLAARRGASDVLASGEERVVRLDLPRAASYAATLGYARFDPPEAARAALAALREELPPDVRAEIERLDGKVEALARPAPMKVVRWPE